MCHPPQHLPLMQFGIFILILIYFFLFVMSPHNDEYQNVVES